MASSYLKSSPAFICSHTNDTSAVKGRGAREEKTKPCIYYCLVSYDKMCKDVQASLIESKQTSGAIRQREGRKTC